jgi:predicted lysophospholipase L1 biosynthesis ABC-type transport system permease subunit
VPREIVGVVGDAHQFGVDAPAEPEFYLPHAQDPWPWLYAVVRTRGDPVALVRDAERAVWSLDPNVPVTSVRTMEGLLAGSLARRRFQMLALGAFAGVAVLLAVVGVYGVMAYLVARRTREIGIRVALGAGRGGVLRLVVGEGARLAALGVGLGLVASLGASRAVARLLYGVSPTDPLTFAGTAALLGGVALLACWVPARRAARVDPVRALRDG